MNPQPAPTPAHASESMDIDPTMPDFRYGNATEEVKKVSIYVSPDEQGLERAIRGLVEDTSNPFFGMNADGIRSYVKTQPALKQSLEGIKHMSQGEAVEELSKIIAFFIEPRPAAQLSDESFEKAKEGTESGWSADYTGQAAEAVWSYMCGVANASLYTRYGCIVQSSGTGKSRAVDELSKKHFVIPINVRARRHTGYPPRDEELQVLLCQTRRQTHEKRSLLFSAFIQALLETSIRALENKLESDSGMDPEERFEDSDNTETIARKFRQFMSAGMSADEHGPYRNRFYRTVINATEKILESAGVTAFDSPILSDPPSPSKVALEKLCKRLEKVPPTDAKTINPLVIIVFDEAQALTDPLSDDANAGTPSQSNFTALRRALRHHVHDKALATLFLSTTGNTDQFASSRSRDPSARFRRGGFIAYEPFVALGFDQFAEKVRFDGTMDLSDVTTLECMMGFGRPLWRAVLLSNGKFRDNPVEYAAMKLLGGSNDFKTLDEKQKVACLIQRLPFEFASTTYTAQRQEQEQVENHLRICLKIEDGFESLVTVNSSEPLVSEAAYFLMHESKMNCPLAFQAILEGFSVHKGDRGEFLVLLSLMMARDQAVNPSNPLEYAGVGCVCTVPDFLKALFRPKQAEVLSSKGMALRTSEGMALVSSCSAIDTPLQEAFKDSTIYCTHWIKVHQKEIVNTEYLVRLLARGAAILCANNHPGIDGVIPYLYSGTSLKSSNIGAILWQAKNDRNYGDTPKIELFTAMDPYATGLFSAGEPSKVPIIRIVFALAAEKPSITIMNAGQAKHAGQVQDRVFVTYDIWVAGLGPEIFGVMPDKGVWDSLLQASNDWEYPYKNADARRSTLTKTMNPGTAVDKPFWDCWTQT